MPKPRDLSGLKLSGKYELVQRLGYGGFGAAYLAKSLYFEGEQVVIKILHEDLAADPHFTERFRREAVAARRIKHPHVVTVYDYDYDPARPHAPAYIVMELVVGESLDKFLARTGRLTLKHAAALFTHICATVGAMHAQNVWHRDLKPQNIMVLPPAQAGGNPDRAVLLDFGLAKISDGTMPELTMTGEYIGSYHYMPPEQWNDLKTIDARADVYSLGVILYQMLAGRRPFEGNMQQVARQLSFPPPPFDKSLNIPAQLEEVIMQSLAKKPPERPVDANELGRLVQAALAQTPSRTFTFETVTVNERGDIVRRRPKQARYFREERHGLDLEMVEIPAGRFLMGTGPAEISALREEARRYGLAEDWIAGETPQHRVTVAQPFYLGKYAVTQKQWRVVAGWPQVGLELDPAPAYFHGDDLPVEQVSWFDAQEFCQRLQQATGRLYRLPGEAEWEYACRAGTVTPFPYGPTITPELVNYDGNYPYGQAQKGLYRKRTYAVNAGPPNGFGLYNMCGNVWEWCLDEGRDDYQEPPVSGSVSGGIANLHGTGATPRVLRGGSWGHLAHYCRSAQFIRWLPDLRDWFVGFRVAAALTS